VRIRLIAVGKIRERYVAQAVDDFAMRLRRYAPLEIVEVPASPGSDPLRAMHEEGERILRAAEGAELLWLLERGGTQLSSQELATRLAAQADAGMMRITFAICGTFGASAALLERAHFCWSLSRLTLLHEWTRALVLEQLYRAAKIARNEPYHH